MTAESLQLAINHNYHIETKAHKAAQETDMMSDLSRFPP